jgi:tetratricopeptide (TPR) repeat protein
MRNFLNYTSLMILFWSCSVPKEATVDEIISNLEHQLDSINTYSNPVRGEAIADSLLQLSPNNLIAISNKAYSNLNNEQFQVALKYFRILIQSNKADPFSYVAIGICHERTEQIDSSLHYYRIALTKIDSSWRSPIREPQLLTILDGKEAGLNALRDIQSQISQLHFHQQFNNISRYKKGGLSELDPFYNSDFTEDEFYVTIPDSLYDNGIINSMSTLEFAFARMGINVTCFGTDHENKGFRFKITSLYSKEVNALDTLNIKKL